MTRLKTLAAALAATTVLAGAAAAAEVAAPPTHATPDAAAGAQQTRADSDAGKLSADGIAAYRDVRLARLAIYEAKPDQARMFVSDAQSALGRARTDAAAFAKAEADLKPPAGMGTAATMAGADGARVGADKGAAPDTRPGAGSDATADANAPGKTAPDKTAPGKIASGKMAPAKTAPGKTASAEPTTWLPVDAQLVLADDFVVKGQDQAKAVDEANQHLKAGDRKGAMDRLKLAGVDVDFTMAVVPLDRTVQGVDDAARLIRDGKYYEANAALKGVEDGVRFDVVDTTAVPQPAKAAKAGGAAAETTGTAAPAKAH